MYTDLNESTEADTIADPCLDLPYVDVAMANRCNIDLNGQGKEEKYFLQPNPHIIELYLNMVVDSQIKFKFFHAASGGPFIFQLQENIFYQLKDRLEELTFGTVTLIIVEKSWKESLKEVNPSHACLLIITR
jgi:hypothetical protein